MLVFLKRHIITLSLLIASAIVGFVVYSKTYPVDVWLIEYEYKTADLSKLQNFAQVDTVFLHKDLLCRNETGSIADTLVEQGIRRHELKIEMELPTKMAIQDLADALLTSDYVSVINHRSRGIRKDKRVILYWILFGFLGGMIVEFVLAMIKKPSTN
ncbi:MAG: hypothetical protein AB8B56_07935 [Crocinitomicaceae bacterium]